MKRRDPAPHPLLHSLVMMGGTAAVACGGATSGGGGGVSSTGGSGDAPGTGGSPGAGGVIEVGGTTAAGGTTSVAIWPCPPAQWTCTQARADTLACSFPPLVFTTACSCDSARPVAADQCPPSQIFVCRDAVLYDASGSVAESAPFECSCQTVSPDSMGCKAVFDQSVPQDAYDFRLVGGDGGVSTLLCGCAIVYLR